jgi:hypothetical protein
MRLLCALAALLALLSTDSASALPFDKENIVNCSEPADPFETILCASPGVFDTLNHQHQMLTFADPNVRGPDYDRLRKDFYGWVESARDRCHHGSDLRVQSSCVSDFVFSGVRDFDARIEALYADQSDIEGDDECDGCEDAVAEEKHPDKATLTAMMLLSGRCLRLVLPDAAGPAPTCVGKFLNTTYDSGRSGFYFVGEDERGVTFTGLGSNQVKLNEDIAVQPIDGVIVTINGEVKSLRAVGECKFENPYNGPVPIVCRATTELGDFEAEFRTDGRKPDVSRF